MSRSIKFRAWDKQNKIMRLLEVAFIGKNGYFITDAPIERMLVSNKLEDFELMEFTGLQDAAGQDIYEGDIVSDPKLTTAEVKFLNASFVVKNRFSPHWVIGQKRAAQMEVIGNIHEHNDLLP